MGLSSKTKSLGDHAAALYVDRAVVVHLAYEATTELNGADGPAGTSEHALDHTLQTGALVIAIP